MALRDLWILKGSTYYLIQVDVLIIQNSIKWPMQAVHVPNFRQLALTIIKPNIDSGFLTVPLTFNVSTTRIHTMDKLI